jgi:uncharacterized protein (TIGR02001 family)
MKHLCCIPRPAHLTLAAALAVVLAPGAAMAQDASASPFEVSGSVSLVSDYRFRGVSFSDIGPAIQPYLQVSTTPGFFVSFWGSNVSDFNGATTEIDLSAGWSGTVAGLDTSVGVLAYLYPGGTGTDVVEFFGTTGFALGPATATLGLNWAPAQANLATSNRYLYGAVSSAIPGTPVTLKASLGNERGSFVSDDTGRTTGKWDWLVGVDLSVSSVTLGVAYIGSDLPSRHSSGDRANRLGRDGILLSLSASF